MTTHKLSLLAALACVAPTTLSLAHAQDQTINVGVGLDYSTGDYGSGTDTRILSMPVTGRYAVGPWAFEATLPYLRVSGPGDVVPGLGQVGSVKGHQKGTPGAPSTSVRTTESGMGDLVTGATYSIPTGSPDGLNLDVNGKIKFGTADEDKGLGTGQNDYSIQFDASKAYTPQLSVYVGVGYAILGSSDATPLDNVFFGTVGVRYKIDDRLSAGLGLNLREAAASFTRQQADLRASVSYRLDTNLALQGYVLKGFADGSPNRGIGVHVVWNF